ncbi:hypothetical protein CRE_18113 [Caenorhabditis remanei]|uniref:F-box domain-containing protein n=1 Tax=Caenorhabditis remanei TaxID=31234 RepID=E3N352_CAERE|nr:hypothetical protein CRE_18113 [Caenorhabditis remanei]
MPPKPLSYPALKCVLENLEAVKRFHITARSPGLQKIDKLVPIRLDNLCMARYELIFNELSIEFWPDVVFNNMRTGKSICYSVRSENSMKKMIDYYLVGRSQILLNQLDSPINNKRKADYAANLKLRVNCLNIRDNNHSDEAIHLIHPDCFPLKTIKTTVIGPETSGHPIFQSARTLILSGGNYDMPPQLEDIKKLHNETIVFEEDPFSSRNLGIFKFIRYLKESVPPGRTFILLQSDGYVKTLLSYVKMGCSRYMDPLDSVQERFIPGAPRFLIPINDTSSIQIYGIEEIKNGRKADKIVFKVVPTDCCKLQEDHDANRLSRFKKYNSY